MLGGFGSGVRIDFKKSFTFELICLYTNSERVRESQQGLNRLLAANNRLLVTDVTPPESVSTRRQNVNVASESVLHLQNVENDVENDVQNDVKDDVSKESVLPETFLHDNVHKLLPTIDALLFAVDATLEDVEEGGDQVKVNLLSEVRLG